MRTRSVGTSRDRGPIRSPIDPGRLTRQERRWARLGVLLAVGAFWLIATCLQPWNLFEKGPFSTDFYDAQARSILDGRLDVPADVAGVEGFVVDGRTHLYFGIAPAVLRLPLSGVSEAFDGRLSLLSELIAIAVAGLAAARLLGRARVLVVDAPRGSPWMYFVVAPVVSLGTPLLFFASRPLVYHEAELWGVAGGLAGLDLVVRWWREQTGRNLAEAVAVAVFALSCRPSSGASPALALGIFGLVLGWRREWGRSITALAGAACPVVVVAIVNWIRFRSPAGIPFDLQVSTAFDPVRQAALADNSGGLFGIKFVPTNLVQYLSPFAFRFDRLFPFVTWPPTARVIGDVRFDTIDRSGSIVTSAPILSFFALVGAWWTIMRDRTREWSALVVATILATTFTFTFAFLTHRYLADLLPTVVVLAAPAFWVIARYLGERPRSTRRAVMVVMAAVFAIGAWNQLGLAILSRSFSFFPTESSASSLARLQYEIDDLLFGGRPPDVYRITADELPRDVRVGTIKIVGDCAAVYRFDGFDRFGGYGWRAIERRAGGGRAFELTGTIPGGTSTPVLSGEGWTLSAVRGADGVEFVRSDESGSLHRSSPVPLGYQVVLQVIADPWPLGVLRVVVDGEPALDLNYVNVNAAKVGPAWTANDGEAPLCELLARRLPLG